MPDHCPHSDHPIASEQSAAVATKPAAGQAFWRSLDELAQTPEFREYLEREFPDRASEWRDPTSRREFLKLMSASLALAGVAAGTAGCDSTQTPDEKIVPYVSPPENMVPGKPQYYATTFPFGGYGLGVLAESHTGRPTKIEGNPDHPASLGATDVFAQASILSLYDPDRSRTIMRAGVTSTWNTFLVELRRVMDAKRKAAGKGLRILTDTVTSPTLTAQIQELLKQLPEARWHRYEPVTHDNVRQGAQVAFGRPVQTVYRFANAQRVLALDAEFSCFGPAGVRYALEFSQTRRVRKSNPTQEKPQDVAQGSATMSRLYVVESTPTTTGASADHRISLRASDVAMFARALAAQLGVGSASGAGQLPPTVSQEWLAALAKDLKEHNGRSLVVVGEYQPPEVHALAHAMNFALGAVGQTVNYIEPLETNTVGDVESIRTLVEEMKSGACDTLVILCGNPAFTAPADVGFADALTAISNQLTDDKRTPRNFTVHLGQYYDETAFRCQWHLPESHYLEAWSDIRAFDGTASIVQPLIAPLYQTRSTHEFLAAMLGQDVQAGREIIRDHWMNQRQGADFESFWRTALQRGVVEGTASQPVQVTLVADFQAAPATLPTPEQRRGFELIFRPDPTIWDGRYANNGWLQELPKPLTKIVWDNVALISYRTAQQLNVGNGDLVILQYKSRRLRIPVWILPGQPDGSITVHLGYGRQMGGAVAKDHGFNAYQLRTTENMWFASGLEMTKVGRKYAIATTQPHHLITTEAVTKREVIHVHTLEEFQQLSHPPDKSHNEPETGHGQTVHLSLYPEYDYTDGRAWGMSIDQTACMGCNACVVACQAENNIPVVGKEQVATSREMHWLRIDTYYRGNPEEPEGPFFQPMLCQHCEKAPCEVVCPVEATTHSNEGINEMTYNRCIGTRYCSNNCPYKVRRFNFFQYADKRTPSIQLMYNPDVTVRVRGVMEKCTFCVQRVNVTRRDLKKLEVEASIGTPDQKKRARDEMDRLHRELQTACQQACPTEAIVFGDLNWKYADGSATQVQRLRTEPHGYGVLTELNTQPRVNYLARVMNVNPDLPKPVQTSPAAREPVKKARA